MKIASLQEFDDNQFTITADGVAVFICERERITIQGEPRRGFWVMKLLTPMGPVVVERNQYSNDLLERASIHINDRPIYGTRFKFECETICSFKANIERVLKEAERTFGGSWYGEYDSHTKLATLEKD